MKIYSASFYSTQVTFEVAIKEVPPHNTGAKNRKLRAVFINDGICVMYRNKCIHLIIFYLCSFRFTPYRKAQI